MSFTDLFESGEHARNLGHFASIVNIAAVDGALGPEEEKLLIRFAQKLDISEPEYSKVLKNPKKIPVNPHNSADKRLERLHDLFQMIFADHIIDEEERFLVEKYAIALGYTEELAKKLIKRSVKIYSGTFDFEDYRYLMTRE